jgi:hypothetical protein
VRIIYVAPVGRGPLTQLKLESDEPAAGQVANDIMRAVVTRRYFAVGLHDGSIRVIFPDQPATLRFTHRDPPSGSGDPKTIEGPLTS